MLQLGNRIGRPHMLFTTGAPSVFTAGVQHGFQHRVGTKSGLVHANGLFGHFKHTNAFHLAGGVGEVLGDGFAVDADGFKQLGTTIRHVGAHAHLGHDLGQAFAHRFDVVVNRLVGAELAAHAFVHVQQGFHRQVGVHRLGAITCQHREVMHFARRTGFDHQAGCGAQTFTHQMLVNGGQSQQGGDGHLGCTHHAVADDQNVLATFDGIHSLGAQGSELGLDTLFAPHHRVGDVERVALELALGKTLNVAQLGHVGEVQHRLAHLQAHRGVHLIDIKQVGLGTNKGHQRHHDRFADRVDGRVGHLRKQLLEVVVQRLVLAGQHGQRAVVAHGADAFFAVGGHGRHQKLDVFLSHAEGLLAVQQTHFAGQRRDGCRAFHIIDLDAQVFDPLLVGLAVGEVGFELLVVDHAALL